MAGRSKRSYRTAALKGWRTRRANARTKKKLRVSKKTRPTPKRVPRKMWRVTIGAAYEIRQRGKKKNRKGSPDRASYMVRAWYEHQPDSDILDELSERAIEGRDNYEEETPRAFHRDNEDEPNIAVETVEYDRRLLDVIEETNER